MGLLAVFCLPWAAQAAELEGGLVVNVGHRGTAGLAPGTPSPPTEAPPGNPGIDASSGMEKELLRLMDEYGLSKPAAGNWRVLI